MSDDRKEYFYKGWQPEGVRKGELSFISAGSKVGKSRLRQKYELKCVGMHDRCDGGPCMWCEYVEVMR